MYERIIPYWCCFWWKWRERERERELYTRIWLNGSIKILLKVKDKHKNGKLIFSDVKKEKKKRNSGCIINYWSMLFSAINFDDQYLF